MAVLLAHGKMSVLALLFLGSFYARLDECLNIVVRTVERYDMVTYDDVYLLQLFL